MDPNANSTLTPEQIWNLCDELASAHGDLMPEPFRVTRDARSVSSGAR